MSKFALGGVLASAIAAMTLGAAPAQAAIVNTSGICENNSTGDTLYPNGLTVGGININGPGGPRSWAKFHPNNSLQGRCGIDNFAPNRIFTFRNVDGSPITLNSFDIGNLFAQGNGQSGTLNVVFNYAGQPSVTRTYTLNTTDDLERIVFGTGNGITSDFFTAQVTGQMVGFQIHNLDVGATPAVPEPATWAMLIGGFGLIGGAMRRSADRMPAMSYRAV